ncbi:MAG: hypothetical protein GVY18_00385 [Bacteroidetes bacterium]|jgi:hypothetical protein|nr:hypothetical protein [Bacteroidota bacterium]
MPFFTRRLALVLVVGLGMLVTGCRTYGGYGTEAETLEQIQQTVDRFADALDRARGNLSLLQDAANDNAAYADAAEKYAEAVAAHEAALAYARDLSEEAAADPGDYRLLSRAYGAIVTDLRLAGDRYTRITDVLQQTLQTPEALPGGMTLAQRWVRAVPLVSRYQVRPPYYERVDYAQQPPPALRDLIGAGTDTPVLTLPDPPLDERVDTDLSEGPSE